MMTSRLGCAAAGVGDCAHHASPGFPGTIGHPDSSQIAQGRTRVEWSACSFRSLDVALSLPFAQTQQIVSRHRTPHLIGREHALRQLGDAFDRVAPSRGSLVLVSGEAGIGKTRLLEEFASRRSPSLVVRGGCVEHVAYAPWTDALWWLLASVGDGVVGSAAPERGRPTRSPDPVTRSGRVD